MHYMEDEIVVYNIVKLLIMIVIGVREKEDDDKVLY